MIGYGLEVRSFELYFSLSLPSVPVVWGGGGEASCALEISGM